MTFESIISTLTVIASFATKTIGAPSQIKLLLKTRNSDSFSALHNSIIFIAYCLWSIHGYLQKDWTVMIGQGIGILTSGTLLYFVLKFKKSNG